MFQFVSSNSISSLIIDYLIKWLFIHEDNFKIFEYLNWLTSTFPNNVKGTSRWLSCPWMFQIVYITVFTIGKMLGLLQFLSNIYFLPACDLIQNVIESNNLYLLHSIFSGGEKAVFAKLDLPITFYWRTFAWQYQITYFLFVHVGHKIPVHL